MHELRLSVAEARGNMTNLRIERSYEQLTKVLKGLVSTEATKLASFEYNAGLVGALGWIRGGPNKVLDALLEKE